jgi:hypothetical protein
VSILKSLHTPRRDNKKVWLIAALCGVLLSFIATADNQLETKVQVAYLINFTKFVEWSNLPSDTITLCVTGDEAIGEFLSQLVVGRQVKGRSLKVERGQISNPSHCQVLYISQNEANLSKIVQQLRGVGVLTVSDAADFTRHGGMIGFYADEGKIKVEINTKTAQAANLKISSDLLEIARIVP